MADQSSAVNRIALAREAFNEAIRIEGNKLKEELLAALESVVPIQAALRDLDINPWSEPKLDPVLTTLGLSSITGKPAKTTKTRKRLNDDDIMAVIPTKGHIMSGEVASELQISKQTAVKKLDGLAKAGKLNRVKKGKEKTAPVSYSRK